MSAIRVHDRKVVDVALLDLVPHPNNPREGDLEAIVESIRTNGFYGALIVQRSTGHIIAGNHRWKAAKELGMAKVPAIFVDVDDEEALRILLADNKTSDDASYDTTLLSELLSSLPSIVGTGYTQEEFDKLVPSDDEASVEREALNVPLESSWFLIRSPLALHPEVAAVLSQLDGRVDVFTSSN